MVQFQIPFSPELEDLIWAYGPLSVSVFQETNIMEVLFETRCELPDVFDSGIWTAFDEHAWKETAKDAFYYGPIHPDVSIIPPEGDVPPSLYAIRLEPEFAFGDGHHPTTQLCVKALLSVLSRYPDVSSFTGCDLGTGTGVLAILMALLGLRKVDAIDIDETSVQTTQHNAVLNDVEIDASLADVAHFNPPYRYDVITANLLTVIHEAHLDHYRSLLNPNGILILSGVSSQWKSSFLTQLAFYFDVKDVEEKEGWLVFVATSLHSIEKNP